MGRFSAFTLRCFHRCKENHPLQYFVTSKAGYTCDLCGRKLLRGIDTASCRICDFDACSVCVNAIGFQLAIFRPDGEVLCELTAFHHWLGKDVKAAVTAKTGIPAKRQRLAGDEALEDSALLMECVRDPQLTLVVETADLADSAQELPEKAEVPSRIWKEALESLPDTCGSIREAVEQFQLNEKSWSEAEKHWIWPACVLGVVARATAGDGAELETDIASNKGRDPASFLASIKRDQTILVEVVGVGGTLCEVSLGLLWSGRECKAEIERETGIPSIEQRLLVGTSHLYDDLLLCQPLGSFSGKVKDPPEMTLVRRLNPLYSDCMAAIEDEGLRALDKEAVKELLKDRLFMGIVVSADGHALAYASDELKRDRSFVLTAIRQTPSAIAHADECLQMDDAVIYEAVSLDPDVRVYLPIDSQKKAIRFLRNLRPGEQRS